jgi:hypothetical protein
MPALFLLFKIGRTLRIGNNPDSNLRVAGAPKNLRPVKTIGCAKFNHDVLLEQVRIQELMTAFLFLITPQVIHIDPRDHQQFKVEEEKRE